MIVSTEVPRQSRSRDGRRDSHGVSDQISDNSNVRRRPSAVISDLRALVGGQCLWYHGTAKSRSHRSARLLDPLTAARQCERRAQGNEACAIVRGCVSADAEEDDYVRSIVRPYVVTGGRTRPRVDLALETLVQTTALGRATLSSAVLHREHRLILDLCDRGLHSVAEISAHLRLPFGVARVVVADMAHQRVLTLHEPVAPTGPQAAQLMERVLRGLRAL
jgi:hypothetical protein